MAARIGISLDDEQLRLLRSIKGFGKKDAEIAKSLIMAYLSEKGYIKDFNKIRGEK